MTLRVSVALASLLAVLPPAYARNVRVVDFGADLGWGELMYRGRSPERGQPLGEDRNGDGDAANDFVSYWAFSLDEPLNPPGLRYETDQKSAVFYGGLVLYSSNPANPAKPRSISEGHLNTNHELRDDFNFMGGLEEHGSNEVVEAYATWFWQKKDFLNGGDRRRVSFDAGSTIAVHVSRYWGGLHAGRWLVRDGDDFYLSQKTWGDLYRAFVLAPERRESAAENPIAHTTQVLQPADTAWARYRPAAPHRIEFDHERAEFRPHIFSNVTAVGFFVNREPSPPARVAGGLRPPFAFKWYAFRCDAVVDRKPEDALVPIQPVAGPDGRPSFHLGRTEVSFAQWQKVWRLSVGNQYCRGLGNLGYAFDRDGAMGSMRIGAHAHAPDEPVTDVHWVDTVTFCNALSEIEGLTPAYYADAGFSQPYRRAVDRVQRENWYRHAPVYWKRDAEGYRLPTKEEWAQAAVTAKPGWVKATSDGRTHAVATSEPDAQGFFDLIGNVWEYVWPDGAKTSVDVDADGRVLALGGSFLHPEDPEAGSLTSFPEQPWRGHYATGFRVARNAGAAPSAGSDGPAVPAWAVEASLVLPAREAVSREALAAWLREQLVWVETAAGRANAAEEMDPEVVREKNKRIGQAQNDRFLRKITPEEAEAIIQANTIERKREPYPLFLAKTEVPYAVWTRVRNWAESQGYRFNYSGDPGSARHAPDAHRACDPREPVTQVSWYDAVIWCNAASDLLGRTPVYYADPERQHPCRTSLWFRLEMFPHPGNPNLPWATVMERGTSRHSGSGDRIYFSASADGLRLPLDIEFHAANRQPAGPELDEEWTAPQAGGRTHPVGTKAAYANGLCDMNGNVFEWAWDSERVYFETQNGSYRLNGNGYFFEPYAATKPRGVDKRHAYSEYTGVARSFVGFRVATRRAP